MDYEYYENEFYDKAITYFKKSITNQIENEFDICNNIDLYIMIIMSLISGDDNSIKCFGNVVTYYNLALEDIKK